MLEPFTPYTETSEANYLKLRRYNILGVLLGLLVLLPCFLYARYTAETDEQILLATTVVVASAGLIAVGLLGMLGMSIERWVRCRLTERQKNKQ